MRSPPLDSDPMTTPSRGPNASRPGGSTEASPSRAGLNAAIPVVLALGAAGAWWFLLGGRWEGLELDASAPAPK